MDEYFTPVGMQQISKQFNPGEENEGHHNYLGKIKEQEKNFQARKLSKEDTYSTYTKYFTLLTHINLIEYSDFNFYKDSDINEFKRKATDLIYNTMTDSQHKLFPKTDSTRSLFEAIASTLYAVSKFRQSLPESELKKFVTSQNPRGLYQFPDLSADISDAKERESGRHLLRYQLHDDVVCRQIGRGKFILRENSRGVKRLCGIANTKIDHYIDSIARESMKGAEDWGTVGDFIHDILEWFGLERSNQLDDFCEHEAKVKSFDRTVEGETVVDLHWIKKNLNNPIVRKLIPSGINKFVIDFSSSKIFKNIKNKLFKKYQGKDRVLLIVLCGEDRFKFENLVKLRNYISEQGRQGKIEYFRNIKVITDYKFKEFLGLEKDNPLLGKYEEFQEIRDELYKTKQESSMLKLIRLWEESQESFYYLGAKN